MGRLLLRLFMICVGIAVLSVYTGAAIAGYLLLAWLFANPPGVTTIILFLLGTILFSGYIGYRVGTVRLLANLKAVELTERRAPTVFQRYQQLCETMDLQPPPILVADIGAPNALSLGGPRDGFLVLDQQLLDLLTVDELEAILAHELAHIESYDTFLNTLVLTTMRTIVGLVFIILFPVVLLLLGVDRSAAWFAGKPGEWRYGLAFLFRRGVELTLGIFLSVLTLAFLVHSRKREFAADNRAAAVTSKPVALARALSKVHRAQNPDSGLFSLLYVHGDEDKNTQRWFSTHPPIQERIERLVGSERQRRTENLP